MRVALRLGGLILRQDFLFFLNHDLVGGDDQNALMVPIPDGDRVAVA